MSGETPTILAFDVGGTTSRCAVLRDGRPVARALAPTVRGDGLAASMAALADGLLAAEGVRLEDVAAVGISVPGPVTGDRRRVAFTGNLRLETYPLADLMEESLGRPVVLDDDANCAALGEAISGAAQGVISSVTIVAGTGVGAGIVIDGDLHRGAHSLAGELGHVIVAPGGRRCSCGGEGCLEAMANGEALVERGGAGYVSADQVFAAAAAGDAHAGRAVAETGRWLAVGVATIASVLDPDRIVLAGGLGHQQAIVDVVREQAPAMCIRPLGSLLDIRPSALGDDAGLVGAAHLAATATEAGGAH
jgi:glucokinase